MGLTRMTIPGISLLRKLRDFLRLIGSVIPLFSTLFCAISFMNGCRHLLQNFTESYGWGVGVPVCVYKHKNECCRMYTIHYIPIVSGSDGFLELKITIKSKLHLFTDLEHFRCACSPRRISRLKLDLVTPPPR